MRHFTLICVALTALLAAPCPPARACINDSEVENHEREFKSSYQRPPAAAPSPAEEAAPQGSWVMSTFLSTSGVLMMLGAVALARPQPKRRP